MKPVLITTPQQMAELIVQLENTSLVAADTEFFRETTYFPQLALVQIATADIVACIDPLAFDAKPGLKKILLDKNITKVFHSCSQDLEVLYYYLGESPVNIYDTQIANALLTDFHQVGYASLVENELGVSLDKSQTRTNWLQRPLTEKQLQYAAEDVIYLYQLHHILDTKLHDTDRHSWFEEDSKTLNDQDNDFQVASDQLWKRVKGSSRLSRDKLAIAQAIALWREQLAQKKDMTRRRVLADDIVNNLAYQAPVDRDELDQIIPHRFRLTDSDKDQLLHIIDTAKHSPAESWPDNRFEILSPEQKQLLKKLQKIVTRNAEELGISSAVLASKKDLEYLICYYEKRESPAVPDINVVQGWRYQVAGQQLLETIKNTK